MPVEPSRGTAGGEGEDPGKSRQRQKGCKAGVCTAGDLGQTDLVIGGRPKVEPERE